MKALFRFNYLNALAVLTVANLLDVWTSVMGCHHGLMESNPMARNADMSFSIAHGVVLKVFYTLMYLALGAVGGGLFRRYDRRAAEVISMLPLLVAAYCVFGAAFHNAVLIGLGRWYVPDAIAILR